MGWNLVVVQQNIKLHSGEILYLFAKMYVNEILCREIPLKFKLTYIVFFVFVINLE